MKTEINNGKIIAIPESNEDLRIILNALRNSKHREVVSFGIAKVGKVYRAKKECPHCGKKFKRVKLHIVRAHSNKNWSTIKTQNEN